MFLFLVIPVFFFVKREQIVIMVQLKGKVSYCEY